MPMPVVTPSPAPKRLTIWPDVGHVHAGGGDDGVGAGRLAPARDDPVASLRAPPAVDAAPLDAARPAAAVVVRPPERGSSVSRCPTRMKFGSSSSFQRARSR